ncbi:MAG: hypothetical protein KGM47_04225 [Acidobacteriota bacterium]|nr:hypothetical protein [Acidobacteriota bacterium]
MRAENFLRVGVPALLIATLAASVLAFDRATDVAAVEPTIHCRVIESAASAQFHVRLAIFHYANEADRARLGELLRRYDGSAVRFQTSEGSWRAATLLRLKTCFGRGLLVYSSSEPALVKKQEFILRFPALQ